MKETLVAGVTRVERVQVDRANTIGFLGEALRVYSTPPMVSAVEYACLRLIDQHLDDGETSLGVHVAMDHLGVTPLGCEVVVTVTVRSVERRKVVLDALVRDGLEVVGRGHHVRVVTEVAAFRQAVADKQARLSGD